MKQVILALLLFCAFTTVQAQSTNAPKGKVFNLDSTSKKLDPKDPTTLANNAKLTDNSAIYNGTTYPVYMSKSGKLFIIVQAKTSKNWYRKYIQ